MKKLLSLVLVLSFALLAAAGCSNDQPSKQGDGQQTELTPIVVGASPTPQILALIKDDLAKKGYKLEIKEYNDYVFPNTALEDGEIDANYFQHITYMNDFNESNGTHLVSLAPVHYEPMGLLARLPPLRNCQTALLSVSPPTPPMKPALCCCWKLPA